MVEIEDIAWRPAVPPGHTAYSWEVEDFSDDEEGAPYTTSASASASSARAPSVSTSAYVKIVDGTLKWAPQKDEHELSMLSDTERDRVIKQVESSIRLKTHKVSQGMHDVYVRYCVKTGRPTAKIISGKSQVLEALAVVHGIGRDPDEEEKKAAVAFLAEAEKLDIPEAVSLLGYCYQYGEGVKEDAKKAHSLYEKATKLGDPWGMVRLGRSQYSQGQDKAKAKQLILKGNAMLQSIVDSGKLTLEEQSRALSLLHTNFPFI